MLTITYYITFISLSRNENALNDKNFNNVSYFSATDNIGDSIREM